MPRVGWLINNEKVSHEEALSLAQRDGAYFKFPVSAWMALDRETNREGRLSLSPSMAGRCARKKLLMMTEPYWLNPEKVWAMLIGSAVHAFLETGSKHQEMTLEMPLTVDVAGQTVVIPLRGRVDDYREELEFLLDYKTTSDFSYFNKETNKREYRKYPTEEHATQINLYVPLLRHAGFKVSRAAIWYVQPNKDAPRKMVEVPIWDDEDAYYEIDRLVLPLAEAKVLGKLPPCTCVYKNVELDRDLCATVRDEDWRGLNV